MSSEETSKESTAEAETTSAVEQEVIKSVPKLYKTGARQLLDKIKENRDVLHWNNKGELMYENKPISRLLCATPSGKVLFENLRQE